MVHYALDSDFWYWMLVLLYCQSTVNYVFRNTNGIVLCIDSIIKVLAQVQFLYLIFMECLLPATSMAGKNGQRYRFGV